MNALEDGIPYEKYVSTLYMYMYIHVAVSATALYFGITLLNSTGGLVNVLQVIYLNLLLKGIPYSSCSY